MKIEKETGSYNERRYGKPGIATVDFFKGGQGEFKFGSWCGYPGESGLLEIEASENQVIACGQKDFRRPKNSAPEYYHLDAEGKLQSFATKAEAYRWWREHSRKE